MCDPATALYITSAALGVYGVATRPKTPSIPAPPAGNVDQSALQERDMLRRRMTSSFGRQASIRTGQTGALGAPSLGKPSLLGGS